MKVKVILVAALIATAGCSSSQEEVPTNTEQQQPIAMDINVDEFKAKMESNPGIVLDVRTPEEVGEGYITNAQHINIFDADFDIRAGALDKGQPIYVYCKAGGRSAQAMQRLSAMGFSEIYNLSGGITAWLAKGNTVVKD